MESIITKSFSNASDISHFSTVPFFDFLENFKAKLKNAFHLSGDIDHMSIKRGLAPSTLNEIMSCNPLSVGIPVQYGGRGGLMDESLSLLSAAAYESLSLSLTLGINNALFLQPLAKYGRENVKKEVFKGFLQHKNMGGLMITEPNYGSEALSMRTSFMEKDGRYHIQGTKHWGGLTGMANYWIVAARKRNPDGSLQRDIDFFICDVSKSEQNIVVEEYFENLGLYIIPYGRNHIDIQVPATQRLDPQTTGVHMMLDILHRSRMHFPGMGLGFVKRMLDEAIQHCKKRQVGNRSLLTYDQVQHRISRLQASFTICSALCAKSSETGDIKNDLVPYGIEANVIKSVTADLMQEASQSLLQLVGAKGYKLNHIAGRSIVDSRPFQIFEGSNDILYTQISEAVLKLMKSAKETNFFQFLKDYKLTARAADYLKKELSNMEVYMQMSQRKLVELGNIISRIISMDEVIRMGDKGFRADLIRGAINTLQHDITSLLSAYAFKNTSLVVEEYEDNSSWMHLKRKG
jgi:alkylation response protein AidB-like acyl-CoA dehydrogenase